MNHRAGLSLPLMCHGLGSPLWRASSRLVWRSATLGGGSISSSPAPASQSSAGRFVDGRRILPAPRIVTSERVDGVSYGIGSVLERSLVHAHARRILYQM